jgi:hypothetical protein
VNTIVIVYDDIIRVNTIVYDDIIRVNTIVYDDIIRVNRIVYDDIISEGPVSPVQPSRRFTSDQSHQLLDLSLRLPLVLRHLLQQRAHLRLDASHLLRRGPLSLVDAGDPRLRL